MSSTCQLGPDGGLPARTPLPTDSSRDSAHSQALLSGGQRRSSVLSPHKGGDRYLIWGPTAGPQFHFLGDSG